MRNQTLTLAPILRLTSVGLFINYNGDYMLNKSGFVENSTNFKHFSKHEVLELFHSYGFKDADGNELVACSDFLNLVNQVISFKAQIPTPAERIIAESAIEHFALIHSQVN
ncbi:TPA: hypothetical protein ACPZOD_001961 [Yersinia enterocolitica]|nr:hypothetical protein [Yersinia enterocolitica]